MQKICGIYKITNTITGDFYIGSSNDVKRRWTDHKCPSRWNKCKNNPMYLDMKKYGVDKFEFQVIEEVELEKLKEKEQQFIEKLHPTYNNYRAKGWDVERRKKQKKEYEKSDKRKEYQKEYRKQLCFYNSEVLTLNALSKRFQKAGISNPTIEAKKYIIKR